MSLLTLNGVTIRIAGRTLLDGASLTVEPGRRIGLVGRNGAGKSTLLKAIAGEIGIDGGEIRLAARARLGGVKQEAPAGDAVVLLVRLGPAPIHMHGLHRAEVQLALVVEQRTVHHHT